MVTNYETFLARQQSRGAPLRYTHNFEAKKSFFKRSLKKETLETKREKHSTKNSQLGNSGQKNTRATTYYL